MPELDKICVPELRDGFNKRGGVLFWLISMVFSNESLRVLWAMGGRPVWVAALYSLVPSERMNQVTQACRAVILFLIFRECSDRVPQRSYPKISLGFQA